MGGLSGWGQVSKTSFVANYRSVRFETQQCSAIVSESLEQSRVLPKLNSLLFNLYLTPAFGVNGALHPRKNIVALLEEIKKCM